MNMEIALVATELIEYMFFVIITKMTTVLPITLTYEYFFKVERVMWMKGYLNLLLLRKFNT